jgi:quercetin dioxygenase-like cupin family protein
MSKAIRTAHIRLNDRSVSWKEKIVDPRPGVVHRPDTELIRILLSARDSDDAVGVVELDFAPGSAGPPLHLHPTHGEGFYVLAGEMTVRLGDEIITGGPGTWAFAPRNTPHALANLGIEPARLLCVFAPGGFERRFERMLGRADAELSAAEAATRVLGPPLSSSDRAGGT